MRLFYTLQIMILSLLFSVNSFSKEGHYFDGYWDEVAPSSSYDYFWSDGWDTPVEMAGIIYAEAASLRGTKKGGPDNPEGREGTNADRDQIYKQIALTLKCRKRRGISRGTALPADLTNISNPSKDAAVSAANTTDTAWNSANDATKTKVCKTNTHFWMECWKWQNGTKESTLTTNAKWVTNLKKNKNNYICLPGGKGAAIQSGNGWCTFCYPLVPVK